MAWSGAPLLSAALKVALEDATVLVLPLLAVLAAIAWLRARKSESSTRQDVLLQRQTWLDARFGAASAASAGGGAAPQLLRRRVRAEAVAKAPQPHAPQPQKQLAQPQPEVEEAVLTGSPAPLPEPEVVITAEGNLNEVGEVRPNCEAVPEAPAAEEAVLPEAPTSSSASAAEAAEAPGPLSRKDSALSASEAPRSVSESVAALQAPGPARRSISDSLAASAQAVSGELFDELAEHLEASLMQVELSQRHAVHLRRAELHLLALLGGARDLLMRSLREARGALVKVFGTCDRVARLRAVLEALRLSAGRQGDQRLATCRAACDAVEGVLRDHGLQEKLRRAQEEKRLELLSALGEKRLEEQRLQRAREAEREQLLLLEQREALAQALVSPAVSAERGLPAASAAPKVSGMAAESFARREPSMWKWFLDYAEGLLSEVLCFLDGFTLTALEMASRWPRQLQSCSLAGIWRFVHLCAMGARPPSALARAPKTGGFKELWLGRELLLREPSAWQREVAFGQARLLLTPGTSAVVQPLKPGRRWLWNIIQNCLPDFEQDPRFAPLQQRWYTHLMVGTEAVTQANGVQTQEQLYVSWSVCFSAAQGLPRLFLASARSDGNDAWEVDLAECRLPSRAPLPWAAAAQEIHELRAQGRSLQSGLCDATELCSARFQGSGWRTSGAPQLAPLEHWDHLHKELFGLSKQPQQGRVLSEAAPLQRCCCCWRSLAPTPSRRSRQSSASPWRASGQAWSFDERM
ncbi:unnamed protein product [Effrenium voratum]|nr:unnamed protein product [Effrenium voratum]